MLQIAASSPRIPVWHMQQPTQQQSLLRSTVRDWLLAIIDGHGITPRALATRARVAPATVYRALQEDGDFVMSTTTVTKIAEALGEPPPSVLTGDKITAARVTVTSRPVGLGETDVVEHRAAINAPPSKAENNHGRWRIVSEVLNLEGFRPGDVLDFDMSVTPRPGDIVVAQIFNHQRGTTDTVLRQFRPPYLLTRSTDRTIDTAPLYVDGRNVTILGTFVCMIRERAA